MTPERESELFAKLDLMLELHRRSESDMRDLREEMRSLRDGVANAADRISRVEGRIEEQSRVLQLALATRMSRKPAAE